MSREYQVIFAGEGGQGLVVSGTLLGEAASVFEDRYATQTVDYGIASRGGFAMAEVKISDSDIDCPELTRPDYVVTLTQEAFSRLCSHADHGVVVYDSDVVAPPAGEGRLRGFPLTSTLRTLRAKHGSGARINILALGVLLGLEPIVEPSSLRGAFASQFGPASVDVNMSVLEAGMSLATGAE